MLGFAFVCCCKGNSMEIQFCSRREKWLDVLEFFLILNGIFKVYFESSYKLEKNGVKSLLTQNMLNSIQIILISTKLFCHTTDLQFSIKILTLYSKTFIISISYIYFLSIRQRVIYLTLFYFHSCVFLPFVCKMNVGRHKWKCTKFTCCFYKMCCLSVSICLLHRELYSLYINFCAAFTRWLRTKTNENIMYVCVYA